MRQAKRASGTRASPLAETGAYDAAIPMSGASQPQVLTLSRQSAMTTFGRFNRGLKWYSYRLFEA